MVIVTVLPVLNRFAVSSRTRSRVLKNNAKILQARKDGKEAGYSAGSSACACSPTTYISFTFAVIFQTRGSLGQKC